MNTNSSSHQFSKFKICIDNYLVEYLFSHNTKFDLKICIEINKARQAISLDALFHISLFIYYIRIYSVCIKNH